MRLSCVLFIPSVQVQGTPVRARPSWQEEQTDRNTAPRESAVCTTMQSTILNGQGPGKPVARVCRRPHFFSPSPPHLEPGAYNDLDPCSSISSRHSALPPVMLECDSDCGLATASHLRICLLEQINRCGLSIPQRLTDLPSSHWASPSGQPAGLLS